jgi:hypothetical protein
MRLGIEMRERRASRWTRSTLVAWSEAISGRASDTAQTSALPDIDSMILKDFYIFIICILT